MDSTHRAFTITIDGKPYDYRVGLPIDIPAVHSYFSKKGYDVGNLWHAGRHVVGDLSKEGTSLFLKLATSRGMSILTEREREWSKVFYRETVRKPAPFSVPRVVGNGWFDEEKYYLITEKVVGTKLVEEPKRCDAAPLILTYADDIITSSEYIQSMEVGGMEATGHTEFFLAKTKSWLEALPQVIRSSYRLDDVYEIVANEATQLESAPRHGDFAPWHMFESSKGQLTLIDGEHYLSNGVMYYDIAYFIQRVYGVLGLPDVAMMITNRLFSRGYDRKRLRTVLLSRAIGGFLDASLADSPSYTVSASFVGWIFGL